MPTVRALGQLPDDRRPDGQVGGQVVLRGDPRRRQRDPMEGVLQVGGRAVVRQVHVHHVEQRRLDRLGLKVARVDEHERQEVQPPPARVGGFVHALLALNVRARARLGLGVLPDDQLAVLDAHDPQAGQLLDLVGVQRVRAHPALAEHDPLDAAAVVVPGQDVLGPVEPPEDAPIGDVQPDADAPRDEQLAHGVHRQHVDRRGRQIQVLEVVQHGCRGRSRCQAGGGTRSRSAPRRCGWWPGRNWRGSGSRGSRRACWTAAADTSARPP